MWKLLSSELPVHYANTYSKHTVQAMTLTTNSGNTIDNKLSSVSVICIRASDVLCKYRLHYVVLTILIVKITSVMCHSIYHKRRMLKKRCLVVRSWFKNSYCIKKYLKLTLAIYVHLNMTRLKMIIFLKIYYKVIKITQALCYSEALSLNTMI